MSRFLLSDDIHDPERLQVLQSVYDWLEDVVSDKHQLALALLDVPDDRKTFDEVRDYVSAKLALALAPRRPRGDGSRS